MLWLKYIKSTLDLDWTRIPYILILVLSFILTRIPLLNLGFGIDADAWRIANSAFDLKYSHIYHTSRFPGYPFPEYVNSLIIGHGWLATNSATMLLSLISIIFFAWILKDLNVKNKGLLVLTYAFFPILWINSTNTMDYMWAMTFVVIAWFFVLRKKYVLAGLMMGLAVGSRITSVILLPSFTYLIFSEDKKIKNMLYFNITVAIVSFFLFLPLFLQYGVKFITYYPGKMTIMERIFWTVVKIVSFLGPTPAFFALILLFLTAKELFRKIVERDKEILFLLSAILMIFILFIKAPFEREYLIPMVPFGLLLINKICRKELIILLCFLILLNAFVSFPAVKRNNEGKITISAFGNGMIKRNIEERTEQLDYTKRLIDANISHAVVIVRTYLPVLSYLDENVSYSKSHKMMGDANYEKKGVWNFKKDIWYRYLVPLDELQDLQSRGYTIYYIKGIREYTKKCYNFDLNDYNCIYLDI